MILGKIKLIQICPACEICIKEKLTQGHFFSYKSACMVYSNSNIPCTENNSFYIQEIIDLEKLKYISTIENENSDILARPNGRFEINEKTDGYCIDSCHKFMK